MDIESTNMLSLVPAWFFIMFQYFVLFVVFMHHQGFRLQYGVSNNPPLGVYFGKSVTMIAGVGHRLRGDRDIKRKGNCRSTREEKQEWTRWWKDGWSLVQRHWHCRTWMENQELEVIMRERLGWGWDPWEMESAVKTTGKMSSMRGSRVPHRGIPIKMCNTPIRARKSSQAAEPHCSAVVKQQWCCAGRRGALPPELLALQHCEKLLS